MIKKWIQKIKEWICKKFGHKKKIYERRSFDGAYLGRCVRCGQKYTVKL